MVGGIGVEPMTFCMSSKRANQLRQPPISSSPKQRLLLFSGRTYGSPPWCPPLQQWRTVIPLPLAPACRFAEANLRGAFLTAHLWGKTFFPHTPFCVCLRHTHRRRYLKYITFPFWRSSATTPMADSLSSLPQWYNP